MRIALFTLCLCLSACTTWKPVGLNPADQQDLGTIVVIPRGASPTQLDQSVVAGDSIIGLDQGTRRAYAVRDLERITQRQARTGRTETLGLAAGAVAGLAFTCLIVANALRSFSLSN